MNSTSKRTCIQLPLKSYSEHVPTRRELERARDRITGYLRIATAPGATYPSQQAALTGMRKELRAIGASRAEAEDMVSISSRTMSTPEFRAAYLVNAVQRLSESDKAHTQNVLGELNNYRKHVRADNQRVYGAQRLQAAVNSYGPLLGWYSVVDERTTPECLAMNGKNFNPEDPPAAGLPGVTHVNCRCRPGPPHTAETSDRAVEASIVNTPSTTQRNLSQVLSLVRSRRPSTKDLMWE